jgi:hypothetical protein
MAISLSPSQQITLTANVSYALPPFACLVTFQSASAVTISVSNDNSSFTTLATGAASETKSVSTSASFIKADQTTIVNVAKQIAASGLSGTGPFVLNGTYYSPEINDGNSGTTKTINLAAGNEHLVTMTGNCTFTLNGAVPGGRYVLTLATGAGGFTPTLSGVRYLGGTPTWNVAASKYNVVTLYCTAGGILLASVGVE